MLTFDHQVAIGEPGKAKKYPQMSGKKAWRDKMVEMFPKEEAAIDKIIQMRRVRLRETITHWPLEDVVEVLNQ